MQWPHGMTRSMSLRFLSCSLLSLLISTASAFNPDQIAAIDKWQFPESPCPLSCDVFGADPADWPQYRSLDAFSICEDAYVFAINVHSSEDSLRYRACSADQNTAVESSKSPRQVLSYNTSSAATQIIAPLRYGASGPTASSNHAAKASAVLQQLLSQQKAIKYHSASLFSRSGNVVAGLYSGLQIQSNDVEHISQQFWGKIDSAGLASRQTVQLCSDSKSTTSAQTFGVIIDTEGDFDAVKQAVAGWDKATCAASMERTSTLQELHLDLIPGNDILVGLDGDHVENQARSLDPRATCKYLKVQSGNTCSSLANSCGISLSQFQSYNPNANCNNLQVNSYVCCSSGTPPNFAPQPYANGTCYTYTVQSNDNCAAIANTYQMNVNVIVNSNNNTWGWEGCSDLFIGQSICLSSGNPPYPAVVPNTVCGPQVNGTVFPANYTAWAALNPCPLNACCDIFGQCGITSDFCTPSKSPTGAPGTAAPGSNGCISNCGTQIVASGPPAKYAHMGYFEAFSTTRPCLHMDPKDIPSVYDHVHFAFLNITSSFDVDVSGAEDYFQSFLNTDGFNRIISFGGWAFSTDPSTYPIFRQGFTAANRLSFARNVANFVQSYNLQGVDFDWEYPGPSVIPGIPNGSPQDGANYLDFLQDLRNVLPSSYTISITAPASFYYLKNFPIAQISQVVDYIVFMTYDLHGQWDYGNQYTNPGCPAGNCLRSQVNQSETESAISMITKAGVPANMLMLGQPLYGRSFQMTNAGCYTEQCTYTGPNSGALAGTCTETQGYISNWEINQIISNSQYESSVQQYYSGVAGDILVYDSTQWISWMKPSTYNARSAWAQGLDFGGVCDWAMDLNASYAPDGSQIGQGSGVIYVPPAIYSSATPTVTCIPPCTFVFPPWTLSTATTISIPATTMTLSEVWPSVTTSANGATATVYVTSTVITTISIPAITTSTISVWNVEWTNTLTPTLYLTSSIIPPPITLTQPGDKMTTTTLPGIIYTFAPGPFPPIPTSHGPPPPPPPGFGSGIIPVVRGPPGPGGCGIGCGALCLLVCAPVPPCVGICGCIGLGCPDGGGSCIGPSCSPSDNGGGDGDSSSTSTCATSSTVTNCEVACTLTDYGDSSTATNCYTTACSKVVDCQTTGTTTTSSTITGVCTASPASGVPWSASSGASIPVFSNGQWSTPGQQPPTSSSSTTSSSSHSSAVGPATASPSTIYVFSDTNCQNYLFSGTYSYLSGGCFYATNGMSIQSYRVGTTSQCGCEGHLAFCEWPAFIITQSSSCGYDDEVGGGCSGSGSGQQVPTGCYQTTAPAKYVTAEEASNGQCFKEPPSNNNGTHDTPIGKRNMFSDESIDSSSFWSAEESPIERGLAVSFEKSGRKIRKRC